MANELSSDFIIQDGPIAIAAPPDYRTVHELWEEFHTRVRTLADLEDWESRIPTFGCNCSAGYAEIKAQIPPRFDARGDLDFGWTVDVHNAVNTKLEKEVTSLAAARARWNRR